MRQINRSARQDMPLVITDAPDRFPELLSLSLAEFMTRTTGATGDPGGGCRR